jgi:hypothetical protein
MPRVAAVLNAYAPLETVRPEFGGDIAAFDLGDIRR